MIPKPKSNPGRGKSDPQSSRLEPNVSSSFLRRHALVKTVPSCFVRCFEKGSIRVRKAHIWVFLTVHGLLCLVCVVWFVLHALAVGVGSRVWAFSDLEVCGLGFRLFRI